MPFYTAIKV